MCLSKVYLKNMDPENLIMDEVLQIEEIKGTISVKTIFGEEKKFAGYKIGKVNLSDNYVILSSAGEINNA